MLIETATPTPSGGITKKQYGLDEIRAHQPDPATGRSLLTLKTGSQFALGGNVLTWEAFDTLSARLVTLSESHPVALMSEEDWETAVAAHGG